MVNEQPDVLNLLGKLQESTTSDIDEERGSFEKGDKVTYDMLGCGLTNSDLSRMLGTNEHATRANHDGTEAEIVEAIGEEVARYSIMFEDGFIINDVAASELKAVKESVQSDLVDLCTAKEGWAIGEQCKKILKNPTVDGIETAELNSNAVKYIYRFLSGRNEEEAKEAVEAIEDWVGEGYGPPEVVESKLEEDVSTAEVKKLFKSIDSLFAKHLTGLYGTKKQIANKGLEVGLELSIEGKKVVEEFKTNEAEDATQTMKPQEKPNINAEDFHMEDYSEDDLEKVKSKSEETGDAIRQVEDDELKIEPDEVVEPKKESKLKEGRGEEIYQEALESAKEMILKQMEDHRSYDEFVIRDKLMEEFSLTKQDAEDIIIDAASHSELDLGDQPSFESKTNEQDEKRYPKNILVLITGGKDKGKTGVVDSWMKGLGYQDVRFEGRTKQIGHDYLQVGDKSAKEFDNQVAGSKTNEQETTITPSKVGLQKISDEKLKQLHDNSLRSFHHWVEDKNAANAAMAAKAVEKYEDEMVRKGIISADARTEEIFAYTKEKRESNFSFMKKQKPLWLCNECFTTFRAVEGTCEKCKSKGAEKIVKEFRKDIQVGDRVGIEDQPGLGFGTVQGVDAASGKAKIEWDDGKKTEEDLENLTKKITKRSVYSEKVVNEKFYLVVTPDDEGGWKVIHNIWPHTKHGSGQTLKSGFKTKEDAVEWAESKDWKEEVVVDEISPQTRYDAFVGKESEKTEEQIAGSTKEVFKVTWKNTDTEKEESTSVMAFDKADARKEAERSNREITKVEGPIKEESKEESKIDEQALPSDEEIAKSVSDYMSRTVSEDPTKRTWGLMSFLIVRHKLTFDDVDKLMSTIKTALAAYHTAGNESSGKEEAKVPFDQNMEETKKEIPTSTSIEIVRSEVDPDAYIFRAVELPGGGSVNLTTAEGDEREILKRGKEIARSLGAEFLGIVDEKVEEGKLPSKLIDDLKKYAEKHDMTLAELEAELSKEFKQEPNEKVEEQEKDTFKTVGKGLEKADADKLATEKDGQVVVDEEDEKKFSVIVKVE